MGSSSKLLCLLSVLILSTRIETHRPKRMFALCPPHFIRIGQECYFISENKVNYLDAHFECKDRDAHLADPYRQEDRLLRKYLNHLPQSRIPSDIWIGARFNWERNKWQWGHNGNDLTYQSFSQMSADNKDLKFHCAILKPSLKYRWSASSCEQQHQYICQHRMPYVNEKDRQKIYSKWNETFPNEMANEIEIVPSEDDLSRRRRRLHRAQMRGAQINNRQIKDGSYRQRNDIHFNNVPQRDQLKYPTRKTRMGGNRQRNNHGFRRKFELNRNRASGVRQRIQFNNTNSNTHGRQFNGRNNSRVWRQKQRFNSPKLFTTTINPTIRPSTSWATPSTALPPPSPRELAPVTIELTTLTPLNVLSNDVNNYSDNQYRKQIKEVEQQRHEEKLRMEADRLEQEKLEETRKRQSERRSREEEMRKNEQIQNEKRKQDYHREQNEMNKHEYEHVNEVLQEPIQSADPTTTRQRNEQTNNDDEHAVQTNEILEGIVSTTLSPRKLKKLRRQRLHDRLIKLSPEEQQMFFKRKAEKNKQKRHN